MGLRLTKAHEDAVQKSAGRRGVRVGQASGLSIGQAGGLPHADSINSARRRLQRSRCFPTASGHQPRAETSPLVHSSFISEI
jgi:hypothetical protein